MYSSINNERKWLIGYIEQDDGSIITENFHYNTMNFEYKTNFQELDMLCRQLPY
jgi:hypothetical protein